MRRGYEAVGLMAVVCMLLAVTEPSVRSDLYGPEWISPTLLGLAGAACVAVVLFPRHTSTRVGSGLLVSLAFAWRAGAALATDLIGRGGRPVFAVILYVGFSAYISLTWHRVLPAPEPVRARIREWTREP